MSGVGSRPQTSAPGEGIPALPMKSMDEDPHGVGDVQGPVVVGVAGVGAGDLSPQPLRLDGGESDEVELALSDDLCGDEGPSRQDDDDGRESHRASRGVRVSHVDVSRKVARQNAASIAPA